MKQKIIEHLPEFTRVSSKGQLVIPGDIRKELKIKEGDVFATMCHENGLIILKKMENPLLEEDLMILKEVEEAWTEIETGKFKKMKKEEFLKELDKW